MANKWDVFVSHAYEDKNFVKRLVEKLRELEISVWYDEFVLKAGDSISTSIDFGISNSHFGLAVFSKIYFKKFWTKEEIAGMRVREPLFGRIIIPIWLGVGKEEVAKFSVVLADRLGIVTDGRNSRYVATEIAKVVKPDTLDRWHARSAFRKLMTGGPNKDVSLRELKKSPHRHRSLNFHQLSRLRILHAATEDVFDLPFDSWVDNFRRDLFPDREIIWWERLVAMYLGMLNGGPMEVTPENKKNLFWALFGGLHGQLESLPNFFSELPKQTANKLATIGNRFLSFEGNENTDLLKNLSYRPHVD